MVHRSLVAAANSIGAQSVAHRDGWGVAYYINNIPHIIKSASHAGGDKVFTRVSGIVASETVLAHIRQATEGENNVLNSHPFQYGNWVFGHNGQIYNFSKHRMKLVRNIAPTLQRFFIRRH
jgi:glutamine amidotransferase